MKKTLKREVAVVLLGFLLFLSIEGDNVEELRILTTPFVLFAMGAFGMDAYAKQVKNRDVS